MTDPSVWQRLSNAFLRIAQAAESTPGAEITSALTTARQLCVEQSAPASAAGRALLNDLAQRLQVWHDVWPRLGKEAGFRQAVARESRLWAQKLLHDARN